MDNCSQHKRDLFGETDMKKVAEAIGDLHYETLASFLFELQTKLHNDSMADLKRLRFKLSHSLQRTSRLLFNASTEIETAWQISKPFMNQNEEQ